VAGIDLTPGHHNVEVEFRTLHFDTGEALNYQYRLEGADGDWGKPSGDQTVRYAKCCCSSRKRSLTWRVMQGLLRS
jgi:hypothetical protein